MPVQASLDNSAFPIILGGSPLSYDSEVLLTDAARTVALARGTIMAQVAASRKWVPYYWVTTEPVDGTYLPLGVYLGDGVTAAALAAADVTGVPILVGGAGVLLDSSLIVWDKGSIGTGTALGLDTVLKAGNVASFTNWWSMTVRRFLEGRGLYVVTTVGLDNVENT